MKIRHVHARKGEYIKVHRSSNKGGSSGDIGWAECLVVIAAFCFAAWLIITLWKLLLCLLLIAGGICLAWKFRSHIRQGMCISYHFCSRFFRTLVNKFRKEKSAEISCRKDEEWFF